MIMKMIRQLGVFLTVFLAGSSLFGQNWQGSQTVNAGQNMTLSLYIDPAADTVQITMTGPANQWKGYGFGGSAMSGTYAIITDGNGLIEEREMGNHTSGTVLTSSLISSSFSTSGGVTTTTVTRSLTGLTANHYTFSGGAITIPIIWAYGSGVSLAYHGSNRGPSTITMSQDCDIASTDSTFTVNACQFYLSPSTTQLWTASGTYNDTIPNAAGCDSVLTINLSINNNDTLLQAIVCDEYVSPSGNYTWTQTGVYADTIQNSLGCDSVITVDLKVNNTDTIITVETCDGFYVSPSGNYTWTSAGTYLDTIPNSLSCDSIITVNVVFPQFFTYSISPISCSDYTSPSGNHVWTTSGTYMDTIQNPGGCDTIVTVDLTIANVNTSVTQQEHVLTADVIQGGVTYQWLDCHDGYSVIPGETNATYTATANGEYAVAITINGCTDTSACYTVNTIGLGFDNHDITVKYYPNPTTGQVTINLGVVHDNIQIRVVNVAGKEVSRSHFTNTDMAIVEIKSEKGLYFVELIEEGELVGVLKVIKQ